MTAVTRAFAAPTLYPAAMPTPTPTPTATPSQIWRWSILLFAACLLFTFLLWVLRAWIWLGVAPINEAREPFSDTLIHLATAVNCADGNGEWYGRACFVPDIHAIPRAQTYEPWLSLHRMGVNSMWHVQAIAVSMLVSFYLAIVLAFRPRNLREALLVLVLLTTSGVQLAVERGNFDLLIAVLLCLAAASLARPRIGPALFGIAVLSLATMLKLYTGLACATAWLVGRAPWRWLLPASLAALALAVLVVGPYELWMLGQGAPEGATRFSTGARWLFLHEGTAWGLAAVVIAGLVTALSWRRLRTLPPPTFRRWPRRLALFQLAALTALPLFVLKDSYDYRLVLWLPCLALPLALLRDRPPVGSSTMSQPGQLHSVAPSSMSAYADEASIALRSHRTWRAFAIALFVLFIYVAGVELPASWLDRLGSRLDHAWPGHLAWALGLTKQFAAWTLAMLFGVLFVMATLGPRPAGPTATALDIFTRPWAFFPGKVSDLSDRGEGKPDQHACER